MKFFIGVKLFGLSRKTAQYVLLWTLNVNPFEMS